MGKYILYTLTAFTLLSCGGSEGRFRLKGEFEHLRQGEFYIYSNDGAAAGFDTIKVEDGRFDYETDLRDKAVYHLLYPNLSEQVIFGASGDVITLKGDARNLKSVEVKGSEPNEELTAFRLENNKNKGISAAREAAATFMEKSPSSPASVFLFKEYFLSNDEAPQKEVEKHYRALCKARPDDLQLLSLRADVESRGRLPEKGGTLPDFAFTLEDGRKVRASDYRGKVLLIHFWASWENQSRIETLRVRRMLRQNAGKIESVSISLDVNDAERKGVERMDSMSWTSYCDFLSWNSPLVKRFGVRTIPFYLLVGTDGKMLATGSSYEKNIEPVVKKLFETRQTGRHAGKGI